MRSSTRLTLPTPPGFVLDRTVRSHGWFDLAPFDYAAERGTLCFAFALGSSVCEAAVSAESDAALLVQLTTESPLTPAERTAAVEVLRSVLRLDADLTEAARVFAGHPELVACLEAGGGRLLRAPTMFEDVVKMICTTNCSWALTRNMVQNLVAEAGSPGPSGRKAFPSAAELATRPLELFRDTVRAGYRAGFLHSLVARVATGQLDIERLRSPELPTAEVERQLRSIKGVGDYAADCLLRLLGRYDRYGIDSWCRNTFRRLRPRSRGDIDEAIRRRYRRFAPYQGLAMWLDLTRHWYEPGVTGVPGLPGAV